MASPPSKQDTFRRLIRRALPIVSNFDEFSEKIREVVYAFEPELFAAIHNFHFPAKLFNGTDEYHVELRRSPIHGQGVFTTHPVRKGEYLTLFHVGAMMVDGVPSVEISQFLPEPFWFREELVRQYGTKLLPDAPIIVAGHPLFHEDRCCIGHMINDGGFDCVDVLFVPEFYEERVARTCNCKIVLLNNLVLMVVATKDIPDVGTELLMGYGADYWDYQIRHNPRLPTNAAGSLHRMIREGWL